MSGSASDDMYEILAEAAVDRGHAPTIEELAEPPATPTPCPECGYDMRGVRTGICPECGVTKEEAQERAWRRHENAFSIYVFRWSIYGAAIVTAWCLLTVVAQHFAPLAFAVVMHALRIPIAIFVAGWTGYVAGDESGFDLDFATAFFITATTLALSVGAMYVINQTLGV
ncbi:MAG: hypothetical protein ACF8PN_07280 [Phycisphaerales bacterium]